MRRLARLSEEEYDRWIAQLNEPLPGRAPSAATLEAQAKAEGDAFAAFASAFGVNAPQSG